MDHYLLVFNLFTKVFSYVYKRVRAEINWKRGWFETLSRFPKTHWNSIQNCRSFMDDIAVSSNVVLPGDWKKVSLALIRNNGGEAIPCYCDLT